MISTAIESKSIKFLKWIEEYLNPGKGEFHRAHQFTLNQLTYPHARDLHFAAVPDPPPVTGTGKKWGEPYSHSAVNRRFSMLAGLFGTRPGDLLFFYNADPPNKESRIARDMLDLAYDRPSQCRRGIVGIYRIVSEPFSDPYTFIHPDTNYKISGRCPVCETPYAWMKTENKESPDHTVSSYWCPGSVYYTKNHQNEDTKPGSLTLSARLDIEPIAIFPEPIGDNRAYIDTSDPILLWTGRFDSMGAFPGKGGSIRTLLPEEAVKLARLLLKESQGSFSKPEKVQHPDPGDWEEIVNPDGMPSTMLRLNEDKTLDIEFYLNLFFSLNVDKPSPISETLSDHYELENIEYFCSEFPWGAANDQSDFLIIFKKDDRRHKAIHLEFKRYILDNEAMAELMLYVPWIVQVNTQYASPQTDRFEVIPVLIGFDFRDSLKRPKKYEFDISYHKGPKKKICVESPKILLYEPNVIFNHEGHLYAEELIFQDISKKFEKRTWPNLIGLSASDRKWVLKQYWPNNRTKAKSKLTNFIQFK